MDYLKVVLSDQIHMFTRSEITSAPKERLKESQDWQEFLALGKIITQKSPVKISIWRILLFQVLTIGVFMTLLIRLISLQVISGSKFLSASYANQIKVEINRSARGIIYDRNGKVLSQSSPGFRVAISPSSANREELNKSVDTLASILKLDPVEIHKKLEGQKFFPSVTVEGGIERSQVLEIETRSKEMPGVFTEVSPIRSYSEPEVFAHLLGFTGEITKEELGREDFVGFKAGDRIGKAGVEEAYEAYLHGQDGQELIAVNANGRREKLFGIVPSKSGESLTLSIDSGLQRVLYQEMEKKMAEVGSTGGSAVALDPNNGEVLALVSLPSFDNNLFSRGIREAEYQKITRDLRRPLFNRAISALYSPASTFKIINAVAALSEKVITSETKLEAPSSIDLGGGAIFKDWKDHGTINVVRALAQSSDSFFYKVGGGYGDQRGVGPERLASWARSFGLGHETGVGLKNEARGLVPDPIWKKENRGEDWYLGNTYNISIGQGDMLVTPLQLANATSAIANGGNLYKPRLIKGESGKVIRENFVSKMVLETVKQGLKEATQPGGTAWPLRDFKISTAGKTGTGEVSSKEAKPYGWYTAFAPFEKPNIVVTVVLENSGEGSNVAAPVVKKAFEYWFRDQ